jgi:hypothetical protein
VKRVARWGLLAALFVAPATLAADQRDPKEPNLAAEIAWARARWPDQLLGVQIEALLPRLMEWVLPGQTVTAFVYTPIHACRPVELTRAGESLEAAIVKRRWIKQGRQRRQIAAGWAYTNLVWAEGTEFDVRAPDGTWQLDWHTGYDLIGTNYGALSSVEDGVARFDGEPQEMKASCADPVEWLACPGGGERPCERCDTISLSVTSPYSRSERIRSDGNRPVTCSDACPRHQENPELSRLNALARRVSLWRPTHRTSSQRAALYRSRDDCLRDHPAGAHPEGRHGHEAEPRLGE